MGSRGQTCSTVAPDKTLTQLRIFPDYTSLLRAAQQYRGTMLFLLLLFKAGEATSCRSGDCKGLMITGGMFTKTNVEVFAANTTCTIPPFPRPGRQSHSLSVIKDTLVACGGYDTKNRKSCISWKRGQDGWEDFHTLSQERDDHAAVVVDGEEDIIVLGGG